MNCRRLEAAGSHSPVGGGIVDDHGDARAEDNSGVRAEAVVIRGGDVDDVVSPGVREVPFPPRTPVGRQQAFTPLRTRTAASGHSAQLPSSPATRVNAPWPAAWCSCSSTAFLLQLGRIASRHGGIRQARLRPLTHRAIASARTPPSPSR